MVASAEAFAQAIQSDDLLSTATVTMVAPDGRILGTGAPWQDVVGFGLHPKPEAFSRMVMEAGPFTAPGLYDEGPWLWSHWALDDTQDAPVRLAVALDPSAAYARADRIMAFNLGGAVGLVALTAGVAGIAVRRNVARPIQALATQAANTNPADPVGAPPRPVGVAEIDALTDALHGARLRIHEELDARAAQQANLERTNDELEAFAYVASHDLQEPIRKVISFNELLVEEHGPRLDEEGRMLLERSLANARRSQTLVRELLDLARIDRDGLRRAVDMTLLADEVRADQSAPQRVKVASMPPANGSPVQFRQLLHNLVENALKYTDGPIELGHDGAYFVRDRGPGIPSEHHETVFGIFQRLHGRDVAGTGIGLAACKKIVERHGGRIWIDTTPGGGATFRFTLETPCTTSS